MKGWGFGFVIMGIGVFVLPLMGLQFKGLNKLDPETRTIVGIGSIALGAVLYLVSFLRDKAAARKKEQA